MLEQPTDFSAFSAFEREGWKQISPGYAASFGRCTMLAIERLLDAARVAAGESILDLACGPGFGAAAAVARRAFGAGLDFSASMVEQARVACPMADIRQGDAAALPWPDGAFDAVICNFGFNHFPDVVRSLDEALRVLKPGGRLTFTVWDAAERCEPLKLLNDAIAAHGVLEAPLPASPSASWLADPVEARRLLGETGFLEVETTPFDVMLTAPTAEEIFEILRSGTVRIGALIREQSEGDQARIRAALARALEPYRREHGIEVPLRVVMTKAEKA